MKSSPSFEKHGETHLRLLLAELNIVTHFFNDITQFKNILDNLLKKIQHMLTGCMNDDAKFEPSVAKILSYRVKAALGVTFSKVDDDDYKHKDAISRLYLYQDNKF